MKKYYWRWFVATLKPSWTTAGHLSTLSMFFPLLPIGTGLLGIAISMDSVWKASFGVLTVYCFARILLAPYFMYREDRKRHQQELSEASAISDKYRLECESLQINSANERQARAIAANNESRKTAIRNQLEAFIVELNEIQQSGIAPSESSGLRNMMQFLQDNSWSLVASKCKASLERVLDPNLDSNLHGNIRREHARRVCEVLEKHLDTLP